MTTTTVIDKTIEPIENEIEKLGVSDAKYLCYDGSILTTYKNKSKDVFETIVSYFSKLNYEIYSEHEMNGSFFTTMVKNSQMAHVYWLKDSNELNVISSTTAGNTLPPANPEVTSGPYQTTITQMQSNKINGMSYIIQLADGSFVVYDGGYTDQAPALYTKLRDLNGGTEGIHIRAWMLTHSHGDHYPCFSAFADTYGAKVKVDYILISAPGSLSSSVQDQQYLNEGVLADAEKFSNDTVVTTVHTGMLFNFCNLKMEILFTLEELYIDGVAAGGGNFNNTSIVSRLFGDGYSFLLLGDTAKEAAARMESIYGTYLKSDICQAAHHGVEDVPLSFYELVKASILYYPCSQELYDGSRARDVKQALKDASYTKKIYIHANDTYVVNWGYNPA
jgi:hypothetical protein